MGRDGLHLGANRFIPATELKEQTSLSGGPGGQHANKTESRVTLSWNLVQSEALGPGLKARLTSRLASRLTLDGEVQVHVDTHRSQHRNREEARERLAGLLIDALKVDKPRRKTKPSRRSKERRLEGKRQRAQTKQGRKRPSDSD
jgi:ribosome-associated protein